MRVVNPATDEAICELPEDDPRSIVAKVEAARAAQTAWARRSLADRVTIIHRFRALVVARTEDLARILTAEVGKPITQARRELVGLLDRIDFFATHVDAVQREETVREVDGTTERITQEPLGVVANVSAWNYPYFVASGVCLPALLTGNAVLYKPSELATLTGLALADLLHEAGVPADVFAPVVGGGTVGRALVDAPVDAVCFTGSYETGVRIATAVAPRLLPVQLELGGKDALYVCDDVDVGAVAAAAADGAFYNTGQSCCAVERIYVHARVVEPFLEAFVATVRAFRLGDPEDAGTYLGPLARRAPQITLLERQVGDATAAGAQVLTGGTRAPRPGHFFTPTVLSQVTDRMRVMREETFGPLIGIAGVASDDEALARMRDTDYGLTAAVYTPDRDRATRLLAALDVGTAYWNCCDRVSPHLPWSGRHHSGLGTTLSTRGIAAFLRPKAWHLRGG